MATMRWASLVPIYATILLGSTAIVFQCRGFTFPTQIAKSCHQTPSRLHVEFVKEKNQLVSNDVYDSIMSGQVAIVHNFFSKEQVTALQNDAQSLYADNKFSRPTDYGTTSKPDPGKDRAVFRVSQWKNHDNGDWNLRRNLGNHMANLRTELSIALDRPGLDRGRALDYGPGSTEISYTRFGPGAFLKKHVDEHHEELKGRQGWAQPTRRSVTWLIYLNDANSWKSSDGGQLRCFQRRHPAQYPVGARPNGDLQIGWLGPDGSNKNKGDIPVFLDAKRRDIQDDCSLYFIDKNNKNNKQYITDNFNAHPILYVAGSETLVKKILLGRRPDLATRFRLIETPQSPLLGQLKQQQQQGNVINSNNGDADEDVMIADVDPIGGTLVLFDAVTIPHLVLPTRSKARWALSGWFHEDQQPVLS